MIRILGTLIAVVLVGVAVALAIIYFGLFPVAASNPHGPVARWALHTAFENAVARRANGVAVPPGLDDPKLVGQGAQLYARTCRTCHGEPGKPLPKMAQHMLPQPPRLDEAAKEMRPAEIYWVIKHGVKMTGMPNWGAFVSEKDLWALTAFVKHLPGMTPQRYHELAGRNGQRRQADASMGDGAGRRPRIAPAPGPGQGMQATRSREDNGQTAPAQHGSAGPAASVKMTTTLRFVPKRITISVGQTVKWTNVAQVQHTVTADPDLARDPQDARLPDGAQPFKSGPVDPGGTYTHRFTVPGHYKYFCVPHESLGMMGEVIVKP